MNKILTVIGTNHGKKLSRIWIEGKRLVDAGFTVGRHYIRHVNANNITLEAVDPGGEWSHKVSGKGDKPIIDTSGAIVRQVFPETGDDTALQERITTVAKTVDARFDRVEQLIRSLRCLPPKGECTWKDGEQPYKCEFHPTTPWPGHRCPGHK